MMVESLSRRALSLAALLALAGCAGTPGPSPLAPTQVLGGSVGRTFSWIASEAQGDDLLYVSDLNGTVYVFTYPLGSLVGQLSGFREPEGLCSDPGGDVFISDAGSQHVYEFAHGGTTPIRTFSDIYIDFHPVDCSVDPVTGNLAVTNQDGFQVLIWRNARAGKPHVYADPSAVLFECAYDNKGNLFVDQIPYHKRKGTYIGELPNGSKTFRNIKLSKSIGAPGGIQWDGKYVAIEDPNANVVYRVLFSGSSGTVVSTVTLGGAKFIAQFWIERRRLIGPDEYGFVGFWKYPAGGPALKTISGPFSVPVGATVSASP
jgi:hypothetical protein